MLAFIFILLKIQILSALLPQLHQLQHKSSNLCWLCLSVLFLLYDIVGIFIIHKCNKLAQECITLNIIFTLLIPNRNRNTYVSYLQENSKCNSQHNLDIRSGILV